MPIFHLDSAPQQPARIWSRGVILGWTNYRRLFSLAVLLGLISVLPTLYLAHRLGDAQVTPDNLLQLMRAPHFIVDMLLLELLVLVLGLLVNALIIRRLDQAALGAATSRDLQFAVRKLPALLLACILLVITLLIGMIIAAVVGGILGALIGSALGRTAAVAVTQLCVIAAGVFILINLLFFQFAIVLDDKGPVAALNHSCALVFRNWWRTFLTLLGLCVAGGVIAALAMLMTAPLWMLLTHGMPSFTAPDTARTLLIKSVLRLVFAAVFAPFILGVMYVLYRDLKLRHAQKPVSTGSLQA